MSIETSYKAMRKAPAQPAKGQPEKPRRRRPVRIDPNVPVITEHVIDQGVVFPTFTTEGDVALVERVLLRADQIQMGDLIAGQKVIGISVASHNGVQARRFSTEADLDDGADGVAPDALFRGGAPDGQVTDDSRLVWTDDALLMIDRPVRLGSNKAISALASVLKLERQGKADVPPGVAEAYGYASAIDTDEGWKAIDDVVGPAPTKARPDKERAELEEDRLTVLAEIAADPEALDALQKIRVDGHEPALNLADLVLAVIPDDPDEGSQKSAREVMERHRDNLIAPYTPRS